MTIEVIHFYYLLFIQNFNFLFNLVFLLLLKNVNIYNYIVDFLITERIQLLRHLPCIMCV